MASSATRSTVINLRADEPRRALIDRAAQAVGKNRSEFMLDAATREATTVLLDRRFFQLDARAFKRFAAALDAAPSDNPRLRKLLLSFVHNQPRPHTRVLKRTAKPDGNGAQ